MRGHHLLVGTGAGDGGHGRLDAATGAFVVARIRLFRCAATSASGGLPPGLSLSPFAVIVRNGASAAEPALSARYFVRNAVASAKCPPFTCAHCVRSGSPGDHAASRLAFACSVMNGATVSRGVLCRCRGPPPSSGTDRLRPGSFVAGCDRLRLTRGNRPMPAATSVRHAFDPALTAQLTPWVRDDVRLGGIEHEALDAARCGAAWRRQRALHADGAPSSWQGRSTGMAARSRGNRPRCATAATCASGPQANPALPCVGFSR